MKGTVLPPSLPVVCLIPFVITPVPNTNNQILVTISLPVYISPHSSTGITRMKMGVGIDHRPSLTSCSCCSKVRVFDIFTEDARLRIDHAHLHVLAGWPNTYSRLEYRKCNSRVLRRILKKPKPIRWLVRARHDKVKVPVSIEIHW